MPKVHVSLGPVQETLLIPLLGRAEESLKPNGLLQDDKAVEMVAKLDYDFDKWRGIRSLLGSAIRARLFDEEVLTFLNEHPDGSVVEIGAGLNTRFERLDNGRAQWLELDLPDTMALRRQFFEDSERRTLVAGNALETEWLAHVDALPRPLCFVSEAAIIYLDNAQVEGLLARLAQRYPGSTLVTDTTCTRMVEQQHRHDAMRHLSQDAWFRWRCDDPASLSSLGLQLQRSRSFLDSPQEVVEALPRSFRFLLRTLPFLIRRQVDGYRINRFALSSTAA